MTPAATATQHPQRADMPTVASTDRAQAPPWHLTVVADVLSNLAFLCLWVTIATAVLKYRLYEIDRIISRTLAYAIVTGLLVGVYAGLVLLATQVFEIRSAIAVASFTPRRSLVRSQYRPRCKASSEALRIALILRCVEYDTGRRQQAETTRQYPSEPATQAYLDQIQALSALTGTGLPG